MQSEPCCPHCLEPVAPAARACPHCRNATSSDLVVVDPVADARTRYQIARALTLVGSGAPALSVAQNGLATKGGRVLVGAAPGVAQACAAILESRGVASSIEPSAGAKVPGAGKGGLATQPMLAVAVAAVILVGALILWRWAPSRKGGASEGAALTSGSRLSGAELAALVLPSTVAVHCRDTVGTGFFVAPGQVLTCAHVACSDDDAMMLRLPSGAEGSGRVLQVDESLDLALVQVDGIAAPPLSLGDAGDLRVGDAVMVVGTPKGLEFSVTQGVVSNLDRNNMGVAMIQTDAPINPGNSGGPLLDESGRVVGVVALKRLDAEGISLAVPINYVFTGRRPLLASSRQESEGFRHMASRADAQDQDEAARLQATGQRPGLVGAIPAGQAVAAEILWVTEFEPGNQTFEFDLLQNGTSRCSLEGEILTWQKAEAADGGSILKPAARAWLERHGFSSNVWVGIAVIPFGHCPSDALGSGAVLEMRGADADAARVQL